jgi:hypothetical protein
MAVVAWAALRELGISERRVAWAEREVSRAFKKIHGRGRRRNS